MQTEKVKKILFILPSNPGDLILTFPSFDMVKEIYPGAEIDCVVSPSTKEFMKRASIVSAVIEYRKDWHWRQKAKFSLSLRYRYDLIIDFKNTAIPFFAAPSFRTPFFRKKLDKGHKRDFYLRLSLKALGRKVIPARRYLNFDLEIAEKEYWDSILRPGIFIAPASRNPVKRYPSSYYREVINGLKDTLPIVLVGDKTAENTGEAIMEELRENTNVINLISRTTLASLFYIFSRYSRVLITSDSAPLHLASYLDIPVVALFGPTSFKKYGPTSRRAVVLFNKNISCLGCGRDNCPFNLECMYGIKPEEVVKSVLSLL
ncbi:MAG: glycosyltransferase family 9 protein [Candidatus Omnitrophica bacterium]|nr:glycosyltransferase family 9 protein [Candidatus Omnitrophota bacterium]